MTGERYPLVLVPGLMASELYLGDDRIWPPDEFSDYAKLRHLKGDALTVGDLVRVAQPIPKIGLGKIDLWKSFIADFLVGELGYAEGEDLFVFPYDWRRDIRTSARKLCEAMRGFAQTVRKKRKLKRDAEVKFYLMGHSLGTLVCRWCVDQAGGREHVARMMLLGPTDRGIPNSFIILATGELGEVMQSRPLLDFVWDRVLPTLLGGVVDILRSLGSAYQTLPGAPFVYGPDGPIDIFDDMSWLGGGGDTERGEWLSYLAGAKVVQEAMVRPPTIPTTYVYGLGEETPESVHVRPAEGGGFDWANAQVDWGRGDGIILSRSAWPGDLEAGVEVAWVEMGHNTLHHTADVRQLLQNETVMPQSLDTYVGPSGLSPEETREYLQAIVQGDRFVAASQSEKGQRVIALPADPNRPTEDVKAVIASVQPGKPVVILGRKGAGKTEALHSVMWYVAKAGLEPEGRMLLPVYVDLRRYRGEDDLMTLFWATIAESGTRTFHPDQIKVLLRNVSCLVFFDDFDRVLQRHPEVGMKAIDEFLEAYPKVRAVFSAESGSYEGQFLRARHYMLLSRELEKATAAMPQQMGDVIVAIIGDNASNIAIGRESSARSVEVAAEAITTTQSQRGETPDIDYRKLSELVVAARDQEWDTVESIAQELADTIGEKAN